MKKNFLFPAIFLLAVAFLYAYRLDFPSTEYYDEVYHVKTAREFIALSGNSETSHPPFGKMLIALTMVLFGDHSWVWRLAPLLTGLGSLWLFFLLAQKFFKDPKPALFAVFLLALDGLLITQARLAMLNTPMFLFMLLAVWFFIRILESGGAKISDFIGCGISLGLTAGTRWVGLGVLAVLGILFLSSFRALPDKVRFFTRVFLFLMTSALIAYVLTHVILLFIKGTRWTDLWTYQAHMAQYHSKLKATHNYGSEWWGWPVMIRPIWFFFERKEGIVRGIFCVGNPAVLWAFIPAMGYLIWDFLRTRSLKTGFVIAGFFSQWLPWAVIGRVKFFHYFSPAMPFVVLGLALYFQAIWRTGRAGRIFAAAYLLLVLGMAFYWYPLWTGYPIAEKYFQHHLWFKTWI